MNRRTWVGRLLVTAGVLGALAAMAGTIVGVRLLGRLEATLDDSVGITATTLDALARTIELADDVLAGTGATLDDTADTTVRVRDAADATVAVLDGAAEVADGELAGSLDAVQDTLPALVDAAGVIDSTLGALDRLPVGPTYDPDVAFDAALREVEVELAGLPAALRQQADLLRDAAARTQDVAEATDDVTTDLRGLAATLRDARQLVDDLEATTEEADDVLAEGTAALGRDLDVTRALLAVGGVAVVLGQLVPVLGGVALLRPQDARRLLDDDGDGSFVEPGE